MTAATRHKFFLRNFFRHAVLRMPARRRQSESRQIARRLARLPAFRRARVVAATLSLPFEVDTEPLLKLCRAAGKEVVVPVTFPETRRIKFARLPESRRDLTKNVFGILEPSANRRRWLSPRAIQLMVVPGSAFTPRGERLGSGAGYYDRFLAAFRGPTVGLAHSCQTPLRLPLETHDVPVDAVLTPSRTFFR